MQILGWTQPSMVARYQHVVDQLKIDAARRIGSLLWDETRIPPAEGGMSHPPRTIAPY